MSTSVGRPFRAARTRRAGLKACATIVALTSIQGAAQKPAPAASQGRAWFEEVAGEERHPLHAPLGPPRQVLPARNHGRRRRALRHGRRRRSRSLSGAERQSLRPSRQGGAATASTGIAATAPSRTPPPAAAPTSPATGWASPPATSTTTATPICTSPTSARNVLLKGDGRGHFADVTAKAGVASSGWSTSAAFLDYDGDGDLDLFVAHYLNWQRVGRGRVLQPDRRARLLQPENLRSAVAVDALSQQRQRHVHRRHRSRRAARRRPATASAWSPATSTATAASTSSSPTTARRITCG